MKQFKVEVEWTMKGTAFITAKTIREAKEKLENEEVDDILFEDRTSNYEPQGAIVVHDN